MKTKIEKNTSIQGLTSYPSEKTSIIDIKGREYKRIGKTYESLSIPDRFAKVLKLVGFIGLGILGIFIPFGFKSYRKQIKQISKEINLGQEKVIHVVPFIRKETKEGAKSFLVSSLDEMEKFLSKPYQSYAIRRASDPEHPLTPEDPRKNEEVNPVNVEILIKLLIGEIPQVFPIKYDNTVFTTQDSQTKVFSLKHNDNSVLNNDEIHELLEKIKAEITAKIENAENFYEGMIISTLYKDQSNELHLHTVAQTNQGYRTHGFYRNEKEEILTAYRNQAKGWDLPELELVREFSSQPKV